MDCEPVRIESNPCAQYRNNTDQTASAHCDTFATDRIVRHTHLQPVAPGGVRC
jgi:hypothetical protein